MISMLLKLQILNIINLRFIFKKYCLNIKVKNLYVEICTSVKNVNNLLNFFKKHSMFLFQNFGDISVIDFPNNYKRFSVTYNLLSFQYNCRYFVKLKIHEISKLLSVTKYFSSSNWSEREVWDMFGIFFINHPDMRRILTDYNFKGHPLKKEFPVTGFIEVFYSSLKKRVSYLRIILQNIYAQTILKGKNSIVLC